MPPPATAPLNVAAEPPSPHSPPQQTGERGYPPRGPTGDMLEAYGNSLWAWEYDDPEWNSTTECISGLNGTEDEEKLAQAVMRKMLASGAMEMPGLLIPTTCFFQDNAELAILRKLESLGIAKCTGKMLGQSSWEITFLGLSNLTPTIRLKNPRPVFEPRLDVALGDFSDFELARFLQQQGWTYQILQKGHRLKKVARGGYKHGAPKTWYCRLKDSQIHVA